MSANGFSRRSFLRGLAGAAGGAIGTRIAGRSFIGQALAAPTEPTALVMIHFTGGYNAIFASADSLRGKFGVTATNYDMISGVGIDKTLSAGLSPFAKQHMAVIGVRHGISDHATARRSLWSRGNDNAGLVMADALGGTAPIRAAYVGNYVGDQKATFDSKLGGLSFQSINDLEKTIDTLRGGAASARAPKREIAIAGLEGAQEMSMNALAASPGSLASVGTGYDAAIDTLKKPVQTLDLATLQQAYGLNGAAVNSFASRLAAAELMVKSGAGVVTVFDNRWDTHGDDDGSDVRTKMTQTIAGPLKTFLTRVQDQQPNRNVVVCLFGDFSRSVPGSNHQPNLSATVIGKYVKPGTTGRVAANVALAAGTPSIAGMWAYLAAVTKTGNAPFGANPHNLVA